MDLDLARCYGMLGNNSICNSGRRNPNERITVPDRSIGINLRKLVEARRIGMMSRYFHGPISVIFLQALHNKWVTHRAQKIKGLRSYFRHFPGLGRKHYITKELLAAPENKGLKSMTRGMFCVERSAVIIMRQMGEMIGKWAAHARC